MCTKFLSAIFFLNAVCCACMVAQPDYRPYVPKEYDEAIFTTEIEKIKLNNLEIRVIEIFNEKYFDNKRLYCRAWLQVLKNDSIISHMYFDNMASVGGCSGLYWPKAQPSHYVVISKFGDFDGRTIVIDTNGTINNLPGGKFFLSRDGRYIFSIYDSDKNGLAVFDFRTAKIAYINDDLATRIDQWYFQGGKYFSIDEESVTDEEQIETENPAVMMQFNIQVYDFSRKNLKSEKLPFDNLKEENRIKTFPEIKSTGDCQCK